MSTVEFIEEYLGIKLFDYQKKYLDFLDKHPKVEFIPRGRSSLIEINTLYEIVKMIIEQEEEEKNNDRIQKLV